MSRIASLFAVVLLLAACESPGDIAQFWRPVAEPNLHLMLEDAQVKLEYDLSQCHCGIFPKTVPQSVMAAIDQDRQRLLQTAVTKDEVEGQCLQKPSLIVGECMRSRGWEVSNCSGRMPVAGGGAVCAGYQPQ
jgi:hypothetical protein